MTRRIYQSALNELLNAPPVYQQFPHHAPYWKLSLKSRFSTCYFAHLCPDTETLEWVEKQINS